MTGEKSRFKPRNLIVQLVGEDENFNTAYEVVASNLRVELGRRYHAVVRVSCAEHGVRFTLRDLGQPEAPAQSALVPIVVRSKLSQGTSTLAVGGLSKRAPGHHWDGRIEALRIVPGALPEQDASPDAASWKTALLQWNATAGPGALWSWSGEGKTASDSPDAKLQALTDLCQVLLNSSEFLYLH